MDQHITTPITEEVTKKLHSGDYVYITGTIYVARDAAHKRMIEALDRGDQLPIDIKMQRYIIWALLLPVKDVRLDLRAQLQPLVWISMPLPCLILVKKQ
jgi:tartrate dehydratase beta subunit/fumarate hydratase class I family protein